MNCSLHSCICVVAFLCLIYHGNLATVTSNTGEQWTYLYHANTSVAGNLSSDTASPASQWSLSAKLIIQSFKSYKIMKLEDIKTSAYNGETINAKLDDFEPVEDISILTEPFIVYYKKNYEHLEFLQFSSDDTNWSKNIKKAIAGVYQVDFQNVPTTRDLFTINEEQNIHGKCKVKYENLSTNEVTTIVKKINNDDCVIEESPRHTWGNIPLGFFEGRIVRYYNYNKVVTESNVPFKSVKSKASFFYWMLKTDRIMHEIQQTQQFILVNTSPITNQIETTKYIVKSLPTYEFQNTTRHLKPESKVSILSNWMDQFQIIKSQINQNTSPLLNEEKFNIVDQLRNTLQKMDSELLENFKLNKFVGEPQMMNIFSSLLPYIGSPSSLEFIKVMIENKNFHLSDLRLLSLFPLYVKDVNHDTLKSMEGLLDLNNVTSPTIKQNFILSFSNLIHQSYFTKLSESENTTESEEYYRNISKEYVNKYFKLFSESVDHSVKMKYLLGMMNMGNAATENLLLIVQNITESRHFRALAIYSIRPEILLKKHEVYKKFWPIVQNSNEIFEIRAAALSLLLYSDLNSSELYAILNYMNQTSYDPAKQHLHNYFYTSLLSGKSDCERCSIKSLAKPMLKHLTTPETNQGLLTRYHQISYSDEENNFGSSLNVHVVANPITNFANVLKLTLNQFTGRHKTGEFAIYIKAEGICSKLYKEEYERHFAIKELYKILQEMKLVVNDEHYENLHIEMILFFEKRAIFALHINNNNVYEMSDFIDEIIVYLGNNDIITLRDIQKIHFASDIGTPLYTTLNYEHILGTEFGNYDKIFLNIGAKFDDDENYVLTRIRSMWSSKMNFMSYNPLTNLNHGVSKVYSNQFLIKFKMDYNVYDLSITWNDNSSYFDTLFDYKYAVFVDNEEKLKSFCETCKSMIFVETPIAEKQLNLWLWAKNIIVKEINCTNPRFHETPLHEMIKNSHVSYTGLPIAQPFVLLTYLYDYIYYIPQYDICSLSVNTDRIIKEPNLSNLKITFINDALDENYKLNLNFNITLELTQRQIPTKKLLNQWNLNLQRQELSSGVSYELHYDDNGGRVKLDIHSDLDYVSSTPDSDMFSLKPAEPITSETSIRLKEKNTPQTIVEIISLFSVSNDQIEKVNSSKSFELCQKDFESEYFRDVLLRHSPPTKSCYKTSLGFSTYDNYTIIIQFKNVTSKIRQYLEDEILKPIKDKTLSEELPIINNKTFNASIIYSALHSKLNIDVGDTHVVSNYSVPKLVRPWALLKPTSGLIDELRYNAFGLDNVCIIIPRYVISFTGKIIEHDTDTSIIPLIECTNTTRLGLTTNRFTYKLWSDENTFQLGKKEGGYYVMRNGKYLKRNIRAEDYIVKFINDHTFRVTTSRIDLYYNGEYLTIKIKSAFINRMCGMCTTNEYIATNTVNKYFN